MLFLLQRGSMHLKIVTLMLLWAAIVQAELKDVFFHYLVGGITEAEALQDVQQAKALGVDAFALNLQSVSEEWSTSAVDTLFAAAQANDFKLFFSFDMTHFTHPNQFIPYIIAHIGSSAYYHHDGLPFVSTFYGGLLTFGHATPNDGWQIEYVDALASQGYQTYFVPSFSDSPSASTPNFYQDFPAVNGALSWTCWPTVDSNTSVSSSLDEMYMSTRPLNKTYMMALSPLQFKHLSPTENWYRPGALTLLERFSQALSLSPDFLAFLTWNDSGESHYFGPLHAPSTPAPSSAAYDHTAWLALLPALIRAYKAGDPVSPSNLTPTDDHVIQGAFWHHTLLRDAPCATDPLGPPVGRDQVVDALTVGLYASAEAVTEGLRMRAWSGGLLVAEEDVVVGLNAWTAPMRAGWQVVSIVAGGAATAGVEKRGGKARGYGYRHLHGH